MQNLQKKFGSFIENKRKFGAFIKENVTVWVFIEKKFEVLVFIELGEQNQVNGRVSCLSSGIAYCYRTNEDSLTKTGKFP